MQVEPRNLKFDCAIAWNITEVDNKSEYFNQSFCPVYYPTTPAIGIFSYTLQHF